MKKWMLFQKLSGFFFVLIFVLIFAGYAMAVSIDDFDKVLPSQIDVWTKADKSATYDNTTLYEYINGGAELYIAYNFKKISAFRYQAADESEIVIDIFDMGSSYDAFGIFSHGREEDDKKLGQGSEYNSGLLTFWKDRFYVSILAFPETEKKAQTVMKLGRLLERAIPVTGETPPIIALFPQKNLVPDSIHYFHHPILVNSHYYIANENILNIDHTTHAALARYKMDDNTFYMLLVNYPDNRKAQEARESFLRHFLPNAQDGRQESDDGKWTGSMIADNLLAVVFNAPAGDVLESYLQLVTVDYP